MEPKKNKQALPAYSFCLKSTKLIQFNFAPFSGVKGGAKSPMSVFRDSVQIVQGARCILSNPDSKKRRRFWSESSSLFAYLRDYGRATLPRNTISIRKRKCLTEECYTLNVFRRNKRHLETEARGRAVPRCGDEPWIDHLSVLERD